MKIDELVIEIRATTDGVKQGINNAVNELRKFDASAETTKKSLNEIGVTAGVVFAGITVAIGSSIKSFNEYVSIMNGLKSQMDYIGESMADSMDIVKEKSKDGLISEADVASSIKNLTTYGMTLEQASIMIDRLKDSAANNRESHYTLGEAVRTTTEGIKNENSMLSDAAGITKNVAKMIDDYAKELGVTKDSLTESQKAQAIFNQTLEETEAVVGNAAEHASTLGGSMDKAAASGDKLKQAFGESMAPSVKIVVELFSEFLLSVTEFINQNKELVSGVITATTVLSAFILAGVGLVKVVGMVKSLKVSVDLLNLSLGPVGWAIAGISAAVGIFTAVKASIDETRKATEELNEKQKEFNDLVSTPTSSENLEMQKETLSYIEENSAKLEKFIQLYNSLSELEVPQGLTKDSTMQGGLEAITEHLQLSKEELIEFLALFDVTFNDAVNNTTAFQEALEKMNVSIEGLTHKTSVYQELKAFEESALETGKFVKEVERLDSAYNKLSEGQQLSASELNELIDLYPQIASYISQTGDAYLENGEIIKTVMAEMTDAENENLENSKQILEENISATKSNIEEMISLQEQLADSLSSNELADSTAYEENQVKIEELKQTLIDYGLKLESVKAKQVLFNSELSKSSGSNLKDLISDVNTLDDSYRKLADGQRLSYQEMSILINKYPQLASYIAETGDLTLKNGEYLKEVAGIHSQVTIDKLQIEKKALDSSIEMKKAELEAEKEKYKLMLKAAQEYYGAIGISARAELEIEKQMGIKTNTINKLGDSISKLEKQSANITNAMNSISGIGTISGRSAGGAKGAGGTNGAVKALKETTSELEKQLELFEKRKQLTELSATEELDVLEKLKSAYANTVEEIENMDIKIYSKRKDVLRKSFDDTFDYLKESTKGLDENIDFQSIVNKTVEFKEEMIETFKDYPETLKDILSQLDSFIISTTEQRENKVLDIVKENTDNRINEYNREIEYFKAMSGMIMGDNTVFTFTTFDEIGILEKSVVELQKELDSLLFKYDGSLSLMSDSEQQYYENRLKQIEDLDRNIKIKKINAAKDLQKEEEKIAKEKNRELEKIESDRLKAIEVIYKNEIKLIKEANKEILNEIKSRYDEEINLMKEAADTEVSIYEQQIANIDNLMKQDSIQDRDESLLDRINRAKEQLKYETDEANKYELQKEIGILEKDYGKNKRKDELEEQKFNLQAQMKAVQDNVNERIKALEELRDKELESTEKSLNSQVETLEKRLEVEKNVNADLTIDLSLNLEERIRKTKDMYKEKEKRAEENAREERNIMLRGMDRMLNDLFSYATDFSEIGKRHGEAYAAAYNSAVSSNIDSSTETPYGFDSPSSSPTSVNVNFNQVISSQVASPSQISNQTATMLQQLKNFV